MTVDEALNYNRIIQSPERTCYYHDDARRSLAVLAAEIERLRDEVCTLHACLNWPDPADVDLPTDDDVEAHTSQRPHHCLGDSDGRDNTRWN
jgi:hypothetical protein